MWWRGCQLDQSNRFLDRRGGVVVGEINGGFFLWFLWWVSLGGCQHGFLLVILEVVAFLWFYFFFLEKLLWLLLVVGLVVFLMGFGGSQGGGVVVVAGLCRDGFAWWWLGFFSKCRGWV